MISRKFLKGAICALSLVLMPASVVLTPSAYAAPPPVENYAQLPAIYDAKISPDGKKVAMVTEYKGGYALTIFDLDNLTKGPVAGTTFGDKGRPRWIKFVNNNRLFISIETTTLIGGTIPSRFTNIVTTGTDLKDLELLIKQRKRRATGSRMGGGSGYRQFNDYIVDWLYDDPNHVLMGYSEEDRSHTDLMKVNVVTGEAEMLYKGGADTQAWYTDRQGNVRVREGRKDRDGAWELEIKPVGGENFIDADEFPGLSHRSSIVGFLENPNELVVSRYKGGDTAGLSVYNLETKAFTRDLFFHPEYDVEGLMLSGDGKSVVGAFYTANERKVEFFNDSAKAKMERISAAAQDYNIRFIDESRNGDRVLLWASSAEAPSRVLIWDNNQSAFIPLGSTYPKIDTNSTGYVQSVSYTSRDGQTIPAFVTIPSKAMEAGDIKNLPYIILPHGGPYARDAARFDWMAQLFASRGYGVLQMNFRGSTGYGRTFSDAGRDNWEVMQEDVEDGTRWLIEKGYADPDRICIVGWSYGGYAALMGAVKNPDLYKCAGSIAGVTDLNNLIRDLQDYRFGRFTARHFVLRGFDESRDLQDNSPQKRADEIQVPVFLAHGTYDINVHYDQFTRMERALKRADKDFTAISIDKGDHSLMHDGNDRVKVFKALDKFLLENLGESKWSQ